MINTTPLTLLTGSFTATGQSNSVEVRGYFDVSIVIGGSNTVKLQRSFDRGATWKTVASYTADTETVLHEPAAGVLYAFDCTVYATGTVLYVLAA